MPPAPLTRTSVATFSALAARVAALRRSDWTASACRSIWPCRCDRCWRLLSWRGSSGDPDWLERCSSRWTAACWRLYWSIAACAAASAPAYCEMTWLAMPNWVAVASSRFDMSPAAWANMVARGLSHVWRVVSTPCRTLPLVLDASAASWPNFVAAAYSASGSPGGRVSASLIRPGRRSRRAAAAPAHGPPWPRSGWPPRRPAAPRPRRR